MLKTWGTGDEVTNQPLNVNHTSVEAYDGSDRVNNFTLARAIRNLTENDSELANYISASFAEYGGSFDFIGNNSFPLSSADYISANMPATSSYIDLTFGGTIPTHSSYFRITPNDGFVYGFLFKNGGTAPSNSSGNTATGGPWIIDVTGLPSTGWAIVALKQLALAGFFNSYLLTTTSIRIYDKNASTALIVGASSGTNAPTLSGAVAGTTSAKKYLRVNPGIAFISGKITSYTNNIFLAERQLEKAYSVNKMAGESVKIQRILDSDTDLGWRVEINKIFNSVLRTDVYFGNLMNSIQVLQALFAGFNGIAVVGFFNQWNHDFSRFELENLIDVSTFSGTNKGYLGFKSKYTYKEDMWTNLTGWTASATNPASVSGGILTFAKTVASQYLNRDLGSKGIEGNKVVIRYRRTVGTTPLTIEFNPSGGGTAIISYDMNPPATATGWMVFTCIAPANAGMITLQSQYGNADPDATFQISAIYIGDASIDESYIANDNIVSISTTQQANCLYEITDWTSFAFNDKRKNFIGRSVFKGNLGGLNSPSGGSISNPFLDGTTSSINPNTPSINAVPDITKHVVQYFWDKNQLATPTKAPAIFWDGALFTVNKALRVAGDIYFGISGSVVDKAKMAYNSVENSIDFIID